MSSPLADTDRLASRRGRAELMVALAALLVFLQMLGFAQHQLLERRFEDDLRTQTKIIARNAAAAVSFDARAEASEILGALRSAPAIEKAELLDLNGRQIASYQDERSSASLLYGWSGHIELDLPVIASQDRVGRLIVRASRIGVWRDLLRFIGSAMVMLLIALGSAWLLTRRLRGKVREAAQRMQQLAHFDALTGLPNLAAFRMALVQAASQCRSTPAALLFIDLDNFKQINDAHGHVAGDRVLRRVAAQLQAQLNPDDLAARVAGDKFAILLRCAADAASACGIGEALVRQLPQPLGAELPAHVSIGIALLPEHADNAEDAMRWADAALHEVKRSGKNAYQLFSSTLGEELRARVQLEKDLRAAIDARELRFDYQPLFDRDGRVRCLEALSRWQHPQRGGISPVEFIPVAEHTGLIVEVSLVTLEALADDLRHWRGAGLQPPPVAVNLSSRQCRQPLHRAQLLAALDRLGLGPQEIEFELTEGTLFEDLDTADSMVVQLQQRGYALAIDDFGTGYSSLAYLRRLRCQKLKIDRLFIDGVADSADAQLLVEAVIRLSQALGMLVVAEGVDSPADWDWLRAMKCDLFQGFGLSRPLDAGRVQDLLREQAAGTVTRIAQGARRPAKPQRPGSGAVPR